MNKFKCSSLAKFTLAVSLTAFLGCTSIPTIVPDMAMHSSTTVQLDGVHGPLTVKQSKLILARLKKNGNETSIFDKHLALMGEITDNQLVAGNKVELLIDGPATYDAMFAAIERAKDHINMETYIIEDDEIGQHFAQLLIDKQKSGVQVNLLYDSVGSISTPKEFFSKLKDSGINVLEYNPVNPLIARKGWQVNQRDHRKLLIIDGQVAFVGGINISSVYSSGSFGKGISKKIKTANVIQPWRDTHLRIDGPVVADFQKMFIDSWNHQKGECLTSKNLSLIHI